MRNALQAEFILFHQTDSLFPESAIDVFPRIICSRISRTKNPHLNLHTTFQDVNVWRKTMFTNQGPNGFQNHTHHKDWSHWTTKSELENQKRSM